MSDKPFNQKELAKDQLKLAKGAAAPRDRRLPLKSVEFRAPVPVPGCSIRVKILESGKAISHSDTGAVCPQLFYDPELRVVMIGKHIVPFDGEMVLYAIRAKAAK